MKFELNHQMKTFKYILLAGFIIFLVMPLISCASSSDNLASLQKQVPFTIKIPGYFPKGISPDSLNTTKPEKDRYVKDAFTITLNYGKENSSPSISITEENNEAMFLPSDPSTVILNFKGTPVMENEKDISKPTRHFEYDWNYRGIYFHLKIFGYDKTEGEKVVESMIPL